MPTTVTSKGQVTIPKAVRDHLGIKPGSRVGFARTPDGRVELVPEGAAPRPSTLAALRGHAGRGGMSTDEIMALTRGEGADDGKPNGGRPGAA